MNDKKILLFDGVCNFCNFWVRFIFKRNPKKDIYFMALQDPRAKDFLPDNFNPNELESVVYYHNGKSYAYSQAVLKVCNELNFPFPLLSKLGSIIPKEIGDRLYKFIGKRRYQWFGKKEACPLPSPALRKQFL